MAAGRLWNLGVEEAPRYLLDVTRSALVLGLLVEHHADFPDAFWFAAGDSALHFTLIYADQF
jgi:hypothetical protein